MSYFLESFNIQKIALDILHYFENITLILSLGLFFINEIINDLEMHVYRWKILQKYVFSKSTDIFN